METSFFWFGMFSGNFGVRSIVLFKCSGKYIDIYFKLKITCSLYQQKAIKKGAKFFHEGTVCAWMAWAINNIDVDSLTMTRKGGPHQLKGRSLEGSHPKLNVRYSQGIYQGYTSTRRTSGCSPRNMSYRM